MESSCGEEEDVPIPVKPKPLQARHSLLDKLEEASTKANSEPMSKRDNMVSSLPPTHPHTPFPMHNT